MFDKLLGNFDEKREEIQEKLKSIILETEVADGAIHIKANAKREILDIKIDKDKIDPTNTEQLEDLLLTGLNEIIQTATEAEAQESQRMLKEMMPPGFGGLANMFK